jgi:hypothetical protein
MTEKVGLSRFIGHEEKIRRRRVWERFVLYCSGLGVWACGEAS